MNMNEIGFEFTSIDEEGLLPGTKEPTEIFGVLNCPPKNAQPMEIQFASIPNQQALNELQLKSKGNPLNYSLSDDGQTLHAQAGINGPSIFKVTLDSDGTYTFQLQGHIDRQPPPNLLENSYFAKMKSTEGWEFESNEKYSSIMQQVQTDPNTGYQLTLLLLPQMMKSMETPPLQIFWNDQLIHTIDANHLVNKGITFTLEGNPEGEHSKISLVSQDPDSPFMLYLEQVSITSQAQSKVPIDFNYEIHSHNHQISSDHFIINVTTTPPIEVNNQIPFDIYYEQAVYQTIIVSDDSHHHDSLTTINLDALFNNLAIPADNRHVEVVQLHENGLATNVYEVKISDKGDGSAPITVADVQLSFPGGDGGLHVFQRNILIDDGGSTPPSTDHIL